MSYKYADLTTLQELVTKTKALLTDYYLKTETYSQTEVNNLIAGITTITYEIVQTLPTASATTYFNDSKKVYMLRNSASTGTDFYEEYITLRSGSAGSYTYSWELIGTTQIDLSGYVPTSRKVNNKALTADITLTASDVGAVPTTRTVNSKALSSDITLTASDVSAVPTTRTVNSKALSSDITLSASDVGAVPTTRTVNSKALSADITLSASDVGAEPTISSKGSAFNKDFEDTDANIQMNGTGDAGTSNKVARADHVHPSDTTRVPTSRKVNNKALSSDVTLNADDISDTSTTNKFVTATEKSTWSGKQDALPTTTTAGKVLKSTSTAGTVEWGEDTNSDTWRAIKVNGTQILGTGTNTNPLDLVAGTNIDLSNSNGAVTINSKVFTEVTSSVNVWQLAKGAYYGAGSYFKLGSTKTLSTVDTAMSGQVFVFYNGTDAGWGFYIDEDGFPAHYFNFYTDGNDNNVLYSTIYMKTGNISNGAENLVTSGTIYTALQSKANTTDLPTKTSDIINDGSDGTSTYVEDDELVAITTAEVDALF